MAHQTLVASHDEAWRRHQDRLCPSRALNLLDELWRGYLTDNRLRRAVLIPLS